jgi:UDP-galactose transporter B1
MFLVERLPIAADVEDLEEGCHQCLSPERRQKLVELKWMKRKNSDRTIETMDDLLSESETESEDISIHSNVSLKPSNLPSGTNMHKKSFQLLFGSLGIYSTYLYYSSIQEDLFRYRDTQGQGFSSVWLLQVLESALAILIGFIGRRMYGGRNGLPIIPFLKSGISQLTAKVLMSLSLAAGISFPVVVLAKSAKIVPVMLGQLVMGGSAYTSRDYTSAALIVLGTALLSYGKSSPHETGNDTVTGLFLIALSLGADGFTGGLQKKLKKETAHLDPSTYDFLFYSHVAMWSLALVASLLTGEIRSGPTYLMNNPGIAWNVIMSCICSAAGQCFVFYVIACFDPLVCTTITTTRKMFTVLFSISFKGHVLSQVGCFGLVLAVSALLVEVEGKLSKFRKAKSNTHTPRTYD